MPERAGVIWRKAGVRGTPTFVFDGRMDGIAMLEERLGA
jgi:predicted DsbA family dithiol-disulfide isomerase